jgi:hypothetical protein
MAPARPRNLTSRIGKVKNQLALGMLVLVATSVGRAGATDGTPGRSSELRTCIDQVVTLAEQTQGARLLSRGEPHFMLPGGTRVERASFEQADCRLFVALGAKYVQDIELRVQDAEGRLLAVSEGPSATPNAFYCGQRDESVVVSVRMLDGQGEVTLLSFSRLTPDAQGLGTLTRCAGLGMPRPPAIDLGPEPPTRSIAQELSVATADLAALGYGAPRLLARGTLRAEQHETHALDLDPAYCYALMAVGDETVFDLDLRVARTRNQAPPMAADSSRRRTGLVKVCPEQEPHAFDVAVFQGGGAYEVHAYVLTEPSPRPSEVTGESRIAYAEATRRLQARGFFPKVAASGWLRTDESLDVPIQLRAKGCQAFAAIGAHGAGPGKLALTLLDVNSRVLASDARSARDPIVFTCPERDAPGRVVVRAREARGPVRLLLLEASDASSPAGATP